MADRIQHPASDVPAELASVDVELRAWFRGQAAGRRTSELLSRAVAAIPDTIAPRRSPWIGWWPPAPWSPMRRATAQLALVALLLLALLAAGLLVGSQVRRLPPPFGLAAAGQLAFDAGGDIWVAAPDGGGAQVLRATSAVEWGATWSRDGAHIAFWTSTITGGPADLWVMAADGSDARAVVQDLRLSVAAEGPAVSWSPSGDRIAFASIVGGLYVASIDGSAVAELTGGAFGSISTPAWSPDGTQIAFRGQPYRWGSATLYTIHPDGTGLETVSEQPGGSGGHLLADWSPDGRRLTYSDGVDDILVATLEPDGWVERVLVGGTDNDRYPAWSPDGRQIVFVRTDDSVTDALWNPEGNEVGRLYLVDPSGGAPLLLAPTLVAGVATHCFSPDGALVRALVAQRGLLAPAAIVPRYVLIDVATGRTVAELAAGDTLAIAACSWQRLAE